MSVESHIFAFIAPYREQDEGHNYLRSCQGNEQTGHQVHGDKAPLTDPPTQDRRPIPFRYGPCVWDYRLRGAHAPRHSTYLPLMLGACMPGTRPTCRRAPPRRDESTMPAMKRFSAPRPVPPHAFQSRHPARFPRTQLQTGIGRPLNISRASKTRSRPRHRQPAAHLDSRSQPPRAPAAHRGRDRRGARPFGTPPTSRSRPCRAAKSAATCRKPPVSWCPRRACRVPPRAPQPDHQLGRC